MKRRINSLVVVYLISACALQAGAATVAKIPHSLFQAVDAAGGLTYNITDKVILDGILLNNPGDMLDPTPNDTITDIYNLSAQWQFFFQGEGNDHAGTAVFIAQLYGNLPWGEGSYSNQEFIAELSRLNSAQFSPGDRIRVTGYYLAYKGKNNINEQHKVSPNYNFSIELLEKGVGLPRPEIAALDELKDVNDNFVFDPARLIGCEYYQGRLVKIEGVSFVDPNTAHQNWGPNATLTVTDGIKTFPIKLGRGNGIYAGANNLAEPFDVIGIMDQESSSTNSTIGYKLWVTNYDGNGSVLASREHRQADKPGDINLDGSVDLDDVYQLLEDFEN
jgi:hypothetical protein